MEIKDGVAVIVLDDGKANAVSHVVIDELTEALDKAAADASAVALFGREGKFSAGFDLSVMTQGAEATRNLVGAGGRLCMKVFLHPQPVVAGVTGHALAAGALLALSCDTRIGADVPAKIGLNETAIGMGLPWYGVRLGEARLSKRHLTASVLQSMIYDPAGAVDAGYLDQVVPLDQLESAVMAEATRLGALPNSAYRFTKRRLRQAMADEILAGLDEDMSNMVPPTP